MRNTYVSPRGSGRTGTGNVLHSTTRGRGNSRSSVETRRKVGTIVNGSVILFDGWLPLFGVYKPSPVTELHRTQSLP